MDALSVGIIIIVGCIVFKIISWILICRNSRDEKKRLKSRQNLRPNRWDRNALALLAAGDIEKQDDVKGLKATTTEVSTTVEPAKPSATLMTVTEAAETKDNSSTDPDPKTEDSNPKASEDDHPASNPENAPGVQEESGSRSPVPETQGQEAAGSKVVSASAAGAVVDSVTAAAAGEESLEDSGKGEEKVVPENPEPSPPLPSQNPDLHIASEPQEDPGSRSPDLDPQPDLDPPPSDLHPTSQPDLPSSDLDLPDPRPDPGLEPPPPIIVPSIGGAGITTEAIGTSVGPLAPLAAADPETKPVRPERKKKKRKLTALKNTSAAAAPAGDNVQSPQPVSDFDDYHSIHLKHLPPPDSSPPPAHYDSPSKPAPRPPPRTSRKAIHDRRKMEKKLQDQEGMDF